jgi:cytochrome oxidase assembly protein ShyY1
MWDVKVGERLAGHIGSFACLTSNVATGFSRGGQLTSARYGLMTMYRFLLKPKWIAFTLVVLGAAALMVNLGLWQFDRLGQRRDFNDLVNSRTTSEGQPAQPSWLGADADVADAEWRVVDVVGEFEGKTDALAVSGGYQLISPMVLSTGQTVLINRGGIDVTADIPGPPAGDIALVGRIREVPRALRQDGLTGTYLEAISASPPDGGVTELPLPILSEGNHLSYTLQWLTFAVCVLVGWGLAVRRTAAGPRTGLRGGRRSKHQAVPWRDDNPPLA